MLFAFLSLGCVTNVSCFAPEVSLGLKRGRPSVTELNMIWRSNPAEEMKRKNRNEVQERAKSNSARKTSESTDSSLGGVAQVIKSVEGFKRSQNIGLTTAAFLRDSMLVSVKGSSMDGNVTIYVDGQQRPKAVFIDGEFSKTACKTNELNEAVVAAMNDAHKNSIAEMSSQIQSLNYELRFPSALDGEEASASQKAEQAKQAADAIAKELSAIVVDGVSGGGKIKISLDGQQRAKAAMIDESIIASLKPPEVNLAVIEAIEEAFDKSRKVASLKLKPLFTEA